MVFKKLKDDAKELGIDYRIKKAPVHRVLWLLFLSWRITYLCLCLFPYPTQPSKNCCRDGAPWPSADRYPSKVRQHSI